MKKRVIGAVVALILAAAVIPLLVLATGTVYEAEPIPSTYFRQQLNERARAIYDKLLSEYTGTATKANYYAGTATIDLMGLPYGSGKRIDNAAVEAYRRGNKDLFNDFAAAKDALDLDHSELWYIDSSYLSFRVTQDISGYHVLVGPGRGSTYLLGGEVMAASEVQSMDAQVNGLIDGIVSRALNGLNTTTGAGSYSESDKIASLVTRVHDEVIRSIHYRYEIECRYPQDAKYIRTVYGLATHEGVCEAYARTMQVCLTRLGIECVLVHGLQTKGTPEEHMWNAVNIPQTVNGKRVDRWYVVDATWDDPLTADYSGKRDLTFNFGLDGRETNTYLLVGQSLVGEHWLPSGVVSSGNFEFSYPTVETGAYTGSVLHSGDSGLKVQYSAGGSMEDSVPAGVFTVTYQGMNAAKAREKGLYFMVRMYDYHADGTADVMDEWYYADATFILSSGNPYFGDHDDGLRIHTSTCEYVEIAVTTREPDHRSEWSSNPATSYLSRNPEAGYFHGDESEIIAQSGMLYNVNSTYEAPPYVLTQSPAPNGNATAGIEYRFRVTWDDDLYHILPAGNTAKGSGYEIAKNQAVRIRYTTIQEDLHTPGGVKTVRIAGELPFDRDRDGLVDMDGSYTEFTWIYKYDGNYGACPNRANHVNGRCDVERGCPIVGVEFNFRASDQWIDDVTEYNFSLEGVVGSRSGKTPNHFSVICVVPGLCPACYRNQGIDWNLWGQPTLLDAPENLDLHAMALAGGTDAETLAKLDAEMNREDLNGRLMLVVEDKSKGVGSRTEYEEIDGALKESGLLRGRSEAVSSVFEINFNRICPMVKLKPNNGESLRVQVGYPAGVTYESLGQGKYELKAYHFTRCAENEPCDEYLAELAAAKTDAERAGVRRAHDWGAHIVSVEEIRLIPTPYGIVLMCDAFSPFEIVAFENPVAWPVTETVHTVVVVSGPNGTVLADGRTAVGAAGNVSVPDGGTKVFTAVADPGYVIDSISFGGEQISVAPGTTSFTLRNVRKSDVLSVTFIPQTVRSAEVSRGQSPVAAGVCVHTHTYSASGNGHATDLAPTCTTPGYARAVVCADCGQTITPAREIPATGHSNLTVIIPEVKATCTAPGTGAVVRCGVCGQTVSTAAELPPLGHSFTNYVPTGTVTCRGASMTAHCDREGCDATDSRFDASRAIPHSYTISVGATGATCTADAAQILKCEWCGDTVTVRKPGTATGHRWGSNGFCTVCGKYRCLEEGHVLVDIPAVKGSCTQNAMTAGKKCSVCGCVTAPPATIPAPGHNYGEDGVCTVCGHRRIHAYNEHTSEIIPARAATCMSSGLTEGTRCKVCGDITNPQRAVPMTAHQWDVSEAGVTWHWCTTDGVSAAAEIRCLSGNHTVVVEAGIGSMALKGREPTCTEAGFGSCMAMVTLDDTHSVSSTVDNVAIPAVGHKVAEYRYNSDNTCEKYGTMTGTCQVCGATVTVTSDKLSSHSYTYTVVAPTCVSGGYTVARCSVCSHTEVTDRTEMLTHSFSYGVCVHCGASQANAAPSRPGLTRSHPVRSIYVPFKDVPAGAWYEEDLKYAFTRGIIQGVSSDSFSPDSPVTRVQFITLLARFDFNTGSTGAGWQDASISWAKRLDISDGSSPETAIEREQLVTMLWRYCGSPTVDFNLNGFADIGSVSPWSVDAFRWAVSVGIISGVSPTQLSPQGLSTRAQAAAIFARFAKLVES